MPLVSTAEGNSDDDVGEIRRRRIQLSAELRDGRAEGMRGVEREVAAAHARRLERREIEAGNAAESERAGGRVGLQRGRARRTVGAPVLDTERPVMRGARRWDGRRSQRYGRTPCPAQGT